MRGIDRRQFFRATIPAGGYKAFLEWGEGEHFELRIVEESASGFTALATRPFTVEPKDPVYLRFNERLAEVRLVRVQKNGMGVRLGLELIRDVEQSKKKQWTKRALLVAAVAAAVLVMLVPMALRNSGKANLLAIGPFAQPTEWKPEMPPLELTPEIKKQVRSLHGAALAIDPDVARLLGLSSEQLSKLEAVAAKSEGRAVRKKMDRSEPFTYTWPGSEVLTIQQQYRLKEIVDQSARAIDLIDRIAKQNWPRANSRQLLDRLGPVALALPRTAGELKLSEEQYDKINEIVESALAASEDLHRQAAGRDDRAHLESQANQMLERSRTEALEVLTPEQKKFLEAMPR